MRRQREVGAVMMEQEEYPADHTAPREEAYQHKMVVSRALLEVVGSMMHREPEARQLALKAALREEQQVHRQHQLEVA